MWLRPAEFFGKFFIDPPFNIFKNLGDVILSHSRIKFVLRLAAFLFFSGVFLETGADFLLFLSVGMILSEKFCQLWGQNCFLNCNNK